MLHLEIESRTGEIARSHGTWPCRAGCDSCCRKLSEMPRLTRAEWELVADGLARLPAAVQLQIAARIEELRDCPGTICPFLDRDAGRCLVYDHRPVACRTYGFYVEREGGLYCGLIEARVNSGEMADVVWGNVAGIDAQLAQYGERTSLLDWFNDSLRWFPARLPTPPSTTPGPCGEQSAVPTTPPSGLR